MILFFHHLKKNVSLVSWLYSFWCEICNNLNYFSPVGSVPFFLAIFKIFSLPLVFCSFIMLDMSMDFLDFILFEAYCTFWICRYVSFTLFGIFSAIISSNDFSSLYSISSLSRTLMTWMLGLLVLFHKFLKLC